MSETGLPAWDEVGAEADRLQLASSAAELHGALCGWLAAGGANTPNWLAEVLADGTVETPVADGPLDRLRAATAAALADPGFGFELLPCCCGWSARG